LIGFHEVRTTLDSADTEQVSTYNCRTASQKTYCRPTFNVIKMVSMLKAWHLIFKKASSVTKQCSHGKMES